MGGRYPRGLYAILDAGSLGSACFPAAARVLAEAGISWIQLRMKAVDDRVRYDTHRRVAAELAGLEVTMVANDRADLAQILGCALHLGQEDIPPAAARAILGPDLPIGLSTHQLTELEAADGVPVDYLGFGPIFPTSTKARAGEAVGLGTLRQVRSRHPVCAIGGITPERALACLEAGATAVAMARGLYGDLDLNTSAGLAALGARARDLARALS
jgi:thiamine-phosphate pyrophosphorylase